MSLVLSEPHPDVDKVILSVRELQNIRAEYERLRSINAELLKALEYIFASGQPLLTAAAIRQAKAAIERAKA